jgi:hypothetical protein
MPGPSLPLVEAVSPPAPPEAKAPARPHPAPARTKPPSTPSPSVTPAPAAHVPAIQREAAPSATAPLSADERKAINEHRRQVADELYHPGGYQNTFAEAKSRGEAMNHKALPPTAEEWRALDSILLVGERSAMEFRKIWAKYARR